MLWYTFSVFRYVQTDVILYVFSMLMCYFIRFQFGYVGVLFYMFSLSGYVGGLFDTFSVCVCWGVILYVSSVWVCWSAILYVFSVWVCWMLCYTLSSLSMFFCPHVAGCVFADRTINSVHYFFFYC